MEKTFKMIIAGGKTGGHLFPGIAVAQAVLQINPNAEILFVGTGAPFETLTLKRYGFAHERITSAGIKGKGIIEKIKALVQIPISIIQAVKIVMYFKPDMVLGVGGFSSGPVVVAARLCGVKTAIHEQNSIAGITNRILEHFVDIIFTSFKETKRLTQNGKMVHTGNPIRKNEMGSLIISDNYKKDHNESESQNNPENGGEDNSDGNIRKFTILVTGGSQGARSINTAFLEALKLIEYPEKYRIIHQTGATDEQRVLLEYQKMAQVPDLGISDKYDNISAGAFFNDMPQIQVSADLIICRAGAGTISEITAIGKPSLLVPYPHAADDHQTFNAKTLADNGAAWMVPDSLLSGEILKEKIEFGYSHPEQLSQMAQRAKELGSPFAGDMIASICVKMGTNSVKAAEKVI